MERPRLHLLPSSTSWPEALRQIEGPPEQLWLRGAVELLARAPKLAVVGSRSPTAYGESQARRFARAFVDAGAVVVSGLARGVDHAAHEAALEAGGATIGVLGCGVDRPWPAGPLSDRVVRDGLVLSEFEPGAPPLRRHFPMRNRVISGLCVGVVVIEAAAASGSLITARWAADQGRAVFAVPGRVDHPMARGCHRLIREGATLVESPEEVLSELGFVHTLPSERSSNALGGGRQDGREQRSQAPGRDAPQHGPEPRNESRHEPRPVHAEPTRRILLALRGETLAADELSERLGAGVADVLTELVELELQGFVSRGPGGLYRLA